jgi:hypothetical protein
MLGDGSESEKYILARGVRTDQRRVEGIGASGGQPGSIAREGRSLHVDRPTDIEMSQRGVNMTPSAKRTVATGGAERSNGGVIFRINRRRKTMCGGFE